MKKSIVIIAALLIGVSSFGQKKKDLIKEVAQLKSKLNDIKKAKELDLNDSLQNFSYAFGVSIGNNLKTVGFDSLSYNSFAIALEDVMKGREKITLKDAQTKIQTIIQEKQDAEAKEQSAEGELFLAENGKKSTVVTTQSGLQYEVLNSGDGAMPKPSEIVKVHYTGTLLDGTVFDSSIDRGKPEVFGVTQVIKGWQEALQLMAVGDKWKVYIPQDLAYGQRGAGGGMIPPYAALIFEMELISIEE
jgi:FKBP-type peptidyl-prolyl cis-trans isomerase FklB